MKTSTMTKRFTGLGVALITVPDNRSAFQAWNAWGNVAAASSLSLVLGSTGEAQLMDAEEHRRVLDFVQEVNRGRLPIVASPIPRAAAAVACWAPGYHGLDGLAVVRGYVKPGQQG